VFETDTFAVEAAVKPEESVAVAVQIIVDPTLASDELTM